VYDAGVGMVKRSVRYVPGLYKIFDEILVNAADNKQRDPKMNTLKVVINAEQGFISVYNNGTGTVRVRALGYQPSRASDVSIAIVV
jgi:DNA topoisomerase II